MSVFFFLTQTPQDLDTILNEGGKGISVVQGLQDCVLQLSVKIKVSAPITRTQMKSSKGTYLQTFKLPTFKPQKSFNFPTFQSPKPEVHIDIHFTCDPLAFRSALDWKRF